MFNKKAFIRIFSFGMSTVVIIGTGLLAGCTTVPDSTGEPGSKVEDKNPPAIEENKQDKIMPEFMSLVREKSKPDAIIEFMDENIAEVSKDNVSIMLEELEKAQISHLPVLEEKYYGESIQKSLSEIYMIDFDLDKIYDTEDADLKKLLTETTDMGYKVETAEGMFFPIMNYEYMKKFSPYALDDMKEYIDIMAVETNKVPAKDGALVIGWDEVIERALAQENFIKMYVSSAKIESMKELQKKYLTFMLFGLNNTPLFSYDTRTMDTEAKEVYIKSVKVNADSELMQLLGKYMEILEKSNYKFTEVADKFRKDAVERK